MKNILYIILILFINSFHSQNLTKEEFENKITKINFNLSSENKLLRPEIDSLTKLLQNIKDPILHSLKNKELYKLWEIYDANEQEILKNKLFFALDNNNSEYSLDLISREVKRQSAMNLYNIYESVYSNFTEKIKNSEEGKKLKDDLIHFKQSKVGSIAPSFILQDINGNTIDLNSYRNEKVILLDFWASWCVPCREDNPYLIEFYKEFKNKGLEIISVSRDDDLELLKQAAIKDNMNWINISDKENNSNIRSEYFVSGIPHKVLIDKNGVIIGKWKGSGLTNIEDIRNKLEQVFE